MLGWSNNVNVIGVAAVTTVPGTGLWVQVKPVEPAFGNQQFDTTEQRFGMTPTHPFVNNTACVSRQEQSRNCALALGAYAKPHKTSSRPMIRRVIRRWKVSFAKAKTDQGIPRDFGSAGFITTDTKRNPRQGYEKNVKKSEPRFSA